MKDIELVGHELEIGDDLIEGCFYTICYYC